MSIFLALLWTLFAQADSMFFVGIPNIKNGYYQDLEESHTAIVVENGTVRVCGFNRFSGGRKGFLSRRWSQLGPYLYSGRDRVGTISEDSLVVEHPLPEGKKQSLILRWDGLKRSFVFSLKHPVIGGFQVVGEIKNQSNPELDEACARDLVIAD